VTDHHTMHIVYKNEKVYPSYLIEFKWAFVLNLILFLLIITFN
jgi:hypothetical protein